jgi:phage baseplate assembly protein W
MNTPLRGFAFPFRIDARTGGVAVTEGADRKLQENLKHLLLTRVGERVMVRDYGGGVTDLLHEPINNALMGLARHQITKAILEFEPRVLPEDIAVIPHEGELYLRVEYIHAESHTTENAVIPLPQP